MFDISGNTLTLASLKSNIPTPTPTSWKIAKPPYKRFPMHTAGEHTHKGKETPGAAEGALKNGQECPPVD